MRLIPILTTLLLKPVIADQTDPTSSGSISGAFYGTYQESTEFIHNPGVNCGKTGVGSRILFGQLADSNQYPWFVHLSTCYHNTAGAVRCYECGGSILSNSWVLTAGHCVDKQVETSEDVEPLTITLNSPTKGIIGVNDYKNPEIDFDFTTFEEVNKNEIIYKQIIIHDDFISNHRTSSSAAPTELEIGADIAIIRYQASDPSFTFNANIYPICLPAPETCLKGGDRFPNSETVGDVMTVGGWGQKETFDTDSESKLSLAAMHLIKNDQCSTFYNNEDIPNSITCASGVSANSATCLGDSGGPLTFKAVHNNVWYQYGLLSYGPSSCSESRSISAYTRVSSFLQWIKYKTNISPPTADSTIDYLDETCQDDSTVTQAVDDVSGLVEDLLSQGILKRKRRDTPSEIIDSLFSKGCWCTGHVGEEQLRGIPVDEYDETCRELTRCQRLTETCEFGACKNVSDESGDFFEYSIVFKDNKPEFVAKKDGSCGSAKGTCQVNFANDIIKMILGDDWYATLMNPLSLNLLPGGCPAPATPDCTDVTDLFGNVISSNCVPVDSCPKRP